MYGKIYPHLRHKCLQFLLFSLCCLLSGFLSIPTVYAQLSGTYTIGGADATYANLQEAVVELEGQVQMPTVSAGRDRTLVLPSNSLILSGTGKVPDGRFVAFRWEKISGPSVTMKDENTANLKLSDLEEGEYVFRFTATDNQGGTASDEVNIIVKQPNKAPVVDAGEDRQITLPVSSIDLTANSSDPDGEIATYSWVQLSGPTATLMNMHRETLTVADLEAGTYTFEVTVTDNEGAKATDQVNLTVEEANQVPVVNAGRDRMINLPTGPVRLSGVAHDADGRFVAFRWEKISGPSVNMIGDRTANVWLTDLEEGEYVFRFSATDNRGATASDEVTLTVNRVNQLPVISAGIDRTITTDYSEYRLSGIGYDPDGRFTAFRWEKVSGPEVSMSGHNTANLWLTDFEAGEYVFRFSATDNDGATVSDEVMLTVLEGVNAAQPGRFTEVIAYPNIFRDYVNVEVQAEKTEEYRIMVFDMLGKVYYQNRMLPDSINSRVHTIDFTGREMKEGNYYIRVENKDGSFRKMLKVVKSY